MSFIPDPPCSASSLSFFTDASFLGFGAFFQDKWISLAWPYDVSGLTHISVLELFAVFASVATFSHLLVNIQVIINTDNEAIVSVWSSGTSWDKQIIVFGSGDVFLD